MKSSHKILLIGKPETAFSVSIEDLNGVTVCESILGGIEHTRRERFDDIFVVLSSIQGRTRQALETLRKSNPNASLILLAEMLEEPLAIGLVRNSGIDRPPADDYQICPVHPEALFRSKEDHPSAKPLTSEKELDYQHRIRELEILATQDDLTGLKNRRYINQFLVQILSLARQYHFRVTLLMFDIDDFKHYNDQFGHGIGDQVLKEAGKMIRHCCRGHDVVARVGGDEFAVVFWDLPEKQKSLKRIRKSEERRKAKGNHPREPLFMSERFRKEILVADLPFLGPHGQGKLTISGGLASFPEDGKTGEELLARADEALLEAKRKGKNKIIIIGEKNNHTEAVERHVLTEAAPTASATPANLKQNGEGQTTAKNVKKKDVIKKKTSPSHRKTSAPSKRKKKRKESL